MNWFHRGEGRYVEYGSSFQASRRVRESTCRSPTRSTTSTSPISRAGRRRCSRPSTTPGVRTAGTTFLIYRGRHRHAPTGESALARLAGATLFRHAVWGPRELFYADLFATRKTGCRSQLGLPGARDAHAGLRGRVHGRARPVRLPAAVAARQRHALAPPRARGAGRLGRGGRPPDRRADGGGRRDRGLPGRPRGDRAGRPRALAGARRASPCSTCSTGIRCWPRRRPIPTERRARPVPGPAVRHGLRARPRAARGDRGRGAGARSTAWRGSTSRSGAKATRAWSRSERGELRFSPGGERGRHQRAALDASRAS